MREIATRSPAWRLFGAFELSATQRNSRVREGDLVLALWPHKVRIITLGSVGKRIVIHASFPSGISIVATARQPEIVTAFVSPAVYSYHLSVAAAKQGNAPGHAGVLDVVGGVEKMGSGRCRFSHASSRRSTAVTSGRQP